MSDARTTGEDRRWRELALRIQRERRIEGDRRQALAREFDALSPLDASAVDISSAVDRSHVSSTIRSRARAFECDANSRSSARERMK